MQTLNIKRLRPEAQLPTRATEGSAGYDLRACLESPLTLLPGETRTLPTGLAIELPGSGYVALVFGRSGLGIKHGIVPANAVGVIDSDYRGELLVGLYNHSSEAFTIQHGDRIAQLVILPVCTPTLTEVEALGETQRGEGGLGSTKLQ